MSSYSEIDEFSSYFLEDSYVLAIMAKSGSMILNLEVVLTPEHPDYSADHPGEQHCYRRGRLVFSGVTDLNWKGQGVQPARDASGELDYGGIDSWLVESGGRHRLEGDFGVIEVIASRAEILLEGLD